MQGDKEGKPTNRVGECEANFRPSFTESVPVTRREIRSVVREPSGRLSMAHAPRFHCIDFVVRRSEEVFERNSNYLFPHNVFPESTLGEAWNEAARHTKVSKTMSVDSCENRF